MASDEKRKHKRFSGKIKVDYSDVDDFLTSFASDISEGGLFIETDDLQSVGSKVDLNFLLPKTEKTISAKGIVVRVNNSKENGKKIGMGIEFRNITEDDKLLIKEVVEQITKG